MGDRRVTSESKAFRNLNVSVFLHFVGRQAYSIFVPVMLFQNGFSLALVIAFLTLSSGVTIVTSFLGQRVLSNRNVLYFNVLAVFAEIGLLLMLLQPGKSLPVLALIIVFEGLYYSFYYLYYFAITVHYTSEENTGDNLGNLTISLALASITAPVLGSHVLGDSKFNLIVFAVTVLLLSLVPLIRISSPEIEEKARGNIELGSIRRELFNYGIMAVFEVVAFTLWGVFAYLRELSLLSIASIVVASSVSRIIISYFIKDSLSSERIRKAVMLIGLVGVSAVSMYRYWIPEDIFITNFSIAVFYVMFQLGTQTEIINQFKGSRTYFSSMLLQVTTFSVRIPVYALVLMVGLHEILLLPVAVSVAYLAVNAPSYANVGGQ